MLQIALDGNVGPQSKEMGPPQIITYNNITGLSDELPNCGSYFFVKLISRKNVLEYKNDQINIVLWWTYATYILKNLWITRAALSKRFHSLVDETISNSFRVGNCFLNFSSICEANYGDKKRRISDGGLVGVYSIAVR